MDVIFLVLGLIAFAISILLAYKKRHNTSKLIASVTLGILIATFIMVLPTEWVKEGKIVENPTLYSILSSLLYSFKALGGRQDIAQLETIALSGILKAIYIYVNYIMFALAPILASSLILSFVGDFGEKIRYFFSWTPKHYVFSEINVNSVELAKGVKNTAKRKTLVFCNGKAADKDLMEEAKKLGGIILYKSCNNLKLFFKNYEFFLISENEDDNIELTEDVIAKKEKLCKHNIIVNTFAQSGTNIEVIESMISKKPCAVFESTHEKLIEKAIEVINTAPNTKIVFFNASESDEKFTLFKEEYTHKLKDDAFEAYSSDWNTAELNDCFKLNNITLYYLEDKINNAGEKEIAVSNKGLGYYKNRLVAEWQDEPLKIRFIDEIALFCNNLIFNHPLYDLPDDRKDISVLLVGCGRLGTQMLKTVAWCGQIDGYTLKIRILDKEAKKIEEDFYSQYPEMENYNIKFEDNVDINSKEFEKKIIDCSDATFVCVATGSDELNISTAENIYRILRRNYSGYTPPIFTRIRKIIKSENFAEKGSYLYDRNIYLFGTTSSIFSNETLFNSQLENLAFAVHLCYNWSLDKSKESFEYQKALYDFYTSEYSRRSSMAAALHIPSKLKSIGIQTKNTLPCEADVYDFEKLLETKVIIKSEKETTTKTKKEVLIENEHERWNAFMRSEGFRTVDFETVKKYAPYTRSHKDEAAKLHPCITSWTDLDTLQQQYNELQKKLYLKKSNFKEYDEKLVVEIPEIIKRANELSKEGW